jgi:hypothetical protein
MNLDATPRRIDAAGHSGQNKTVKRSAIRLSNIDRYSASFEFLVDFVLPDLHYGIELDEGDRLLLRY